MASERWSPSSLYQKLDIIDQQINPRFNWETMQNIKRVLDDISYQLESMYRELDKIDSKFCQLKKRFQQLEDNMCGGGSETSDEELFS